MGTRPSKLTKKSSTKSLHISLSTLSSPKHLLASKSHNGSARIVENFVVLWLDTTLKNSNEDIANSIRQLRSIVNLVKTFTHTTRCLEYMASIRQERIFLIISGSLGEQVIPMFEDHKQIDSIYIFCDNKAKHQSWAKDYRRIKGIFSHIESICESLQEAVRHAESNLIPISIMSPRAILDSNELDQSFMYSKLLKEILLDLPQDDVSKQELVDFCRKQYAENGNELKIIDEFQEKYDHPSPIWWYTRECFTYSMLNRALRMPDVEITIKMGFFVRDLHRQIESLHRQSNTRRPFVVYRGQGMLTEELERIRASQGCLLSFNNFLSTSETKRVSLAFARQAERNPSLTAVLFRMKINPAVSSTPFASLDRISYYAGKEKEILFSMHTVFRIDDMKQMGKRLWLVNLTLTSNDDEQLNQLTEHIRTTIRGPTGLHRLGTLMIKMGEFSKAEEIFVALANKASKSDRKQLASLENQLGYIHDEKGDLNEALAHYRQSLEIKLSYLSSDDDDELSNIYSNIGAVLKRQGDLNGALEHLQRALQIDLHAKQPDQLKVALRHNNIGGVLDDQHQHDEALRSYQCALEIRLKHLPPRHPSLATSYNNIAGVHYQLGDKITALSFYEKSLEIDQRSLPSNHPSLSITHHNIARVMENLSRFNEAVGHAKRAVDIVTRTFSLNHPQAKLYQTYLDTLQQKTH